MNREHLRQYARALVCRGLNIKKGQKIYLECPVEGAELASLIVEEAEKIAAEGHPNVYVHIYGKSESRPRRKMGHITYVGMTLEEFERDWSGRFARD